ncbi:8488_t:CDS:2, partial [Dentiscutata erythropus]
GFHGSMLAMVANEAYRKGQKIILIEALKEILTKHRNGDDMAHVDIFILLRCLIRMTNSSLSKNESTERTSLMDCICGYFELASNLIESYGENTIVHYENEGHVKKNNKISLKDLEWFFKMAWNIALEFCQHEEGGSDLLAIRLFDVAYKFLGNYPEETIENINRKKLCLFASLCGKLFLSREQESILQK